MRILLQATLVFFLLATRAWSADFTVNVPVDLSRIPARYTRLQVKCWALCTADATGPEYRNQVDGTDAGQTGSKLNLIGSWLFTGSHWDTVMRTVAVAGEAVQIVGSGTAKSFIPPTTGEFHGSIPVSFNADRMYAPDNVRSYVCGMKVSATGRRGYWEPVSLQGSALAADGTTPQFISKGEFDNPAADTSRPNPSCLR